MGRIVGIDLGTTNSAVAVIENSTPIVVVSAEGPRTVPSVVGYTKTGERVVGVHAKNQQATNASGTFYSTKRLMGQRLNDPGLADVIRRLPYQAVAGKDGGVAVRHPDGRTFAPPEIAAVILAKLKADAERYLGEPVTEAVVTVPAYFTDPQRHATEEAGRIAGLDVKRIINEPTAAALAFTHGGAAKSRRIAIYDLGGGTFDISIVHVDDGVVEVLATNGNTWLGGNDFDTRLVNHLAERFLQKHGADLRIDPGSMQRLTDAAEKARIELSTLTQTEINIPFITATQAGPLHFEHSLTRMELESLVDDLIDSTMEPVQRALDDAGLQPDDVDDVVLVGGLTRMPAVIEAVSEMFNGAEPLAGINPDEAVALGAAVQAGMLEGDSYGLTVLDVTAFALGIEVNEGEMSVLVERNTTIPTTRSGMYSTLYDRQTAVDINVHQGEEPRAADNTQVGNFLLTPVPPQPRGVPQIEVTFELDVDGVLDVSAIDRGTGHRQAITIEKTTWMSAGEIQEARRRLLLDSGR